MIKYPQIDEKQDLHCYHCGEACNGRIVSEEKHFCCTGCQTVYEILENNGLSDYYEYENSPGRSMKGIGSEKYIFLGNSEIAESLLDFSSEDIARVTLYIPDIHCSSCIWLLENLYKLHPAIKDSRVDFLRKEASVTFFSSKISLMELANLLDSLGYSPLINWDSKEKKERKKSFGSLQIKLGVAGFCFGNIMLLSFPEYFGLDLSSETFGSFFSFLNLFLALPVLLYSGVDYIKSAVLGIKNKMLNIDVPIALGMIALFGRSLYEVVSGAGPGYFDSFAGLIFFLLIGRWFQDRTYQNLSFERDYKSYFPLAISRFKGSETEVVPLKDLKNGDIVKIRNNEIVPADCVLLSADTEIDYSFVTGEQSPVTKSRGDLIYAGGRLKGRDIRLEVTKPVAQSYLTSLWNTDKEIKPESQRVIDIVARYFTYTILLIALLTGLYWYFADPGALWETIAAVLIVACPCALALSVPFTYGSVMRFLGRNSFYLKSASVVEKFHSIDTIIFDKTGTLTSPEKGEISYEGQELDESELQAIKILTAASFHPLSSRLNSWISQQGSEPEMHDFEEIPGRGIKAEIDGIMYKIGSLKFVDAPEAIMPGKAVMGVSINHQYKGKFEVSTSYRQGFQRIIDAFKEKYKLGMLSGDNAYDRGFLENVFPKDAPVLFELQPDEKKSFIEELKKGGNKVLMIGDGLNDAVALASSQVGVAITDDISAFSPACDVILNGATFPKLDRILSFIRDSRRIVIGSFIISLLYNVIGLSFAVTGNLTPIFAAILMPLSSLSILAFATLSVALTARLNRL